MRDGGTFSLQITVPAVSRYGGARFLVMPVLEEVVASSVEIPLVLEEVMLFLAEVVPFLVEVASGVGGPPPSYFRKCATEVRRMPI